MKDTEKIALAGVGAIALYFMYQSWNSVTEVVTNPISKGAGGIIGGVANDLGNVDWNLDSSEGGNLGGDFDFVTDVPGRIGHEAGQVVGNVGHEAGQIVGDAGHEAGQVVNDITPDVGNLW